MKIWNYARLALGIMAADCMAADNVITEGQRQFIEKVSAATRIVIRTGSLCHRSPETERCILDSTNAATIHEWTKSVDIDQDCSVVHHPATTNITTNAADEVVAEVEEDSTSYSGNWGCCGQYTISFWASQTNLLEISLHHYHHVSSPSIYRGHDALLLPKSGRTLKALISKIAIEQGSANSPPEAGSKSGEL